MATTDNMQVTALAPWFGSDRMVAKHYAAALKGCRWVGIPFGGGMSIVPHLDAPSIVVGDTHRAIINLALVASDDQLGPALYRKLRRLPFHPEILADAQERCQARAEVDPALPSLSWAVDYFVTAWMGRSGISGTSDEFYGNVSSRWNSNGGDSNKRYRSAVRSLVAWRRSLERCNFQVRDCFAFLARTDDSPNNGLYIDAPWPDDGEQYRHVFTEDDQRRLADWLGRFEYTRVVVRYGDHPLIRELYEDDQWTWRSIESRTQGNNAKAEVLITNRSERGLF